MIIGDLHLSMGDFKPNHCPSVNVLHTSILTTKLQYGDNLLKNRLQRFRGCAQCERHRRCYSCPGARYNCGGHFNERTCECECDESVFGDMKKVSVGHEELKN